MASGEERQLSATNCPCCWEDLNNKRIPYSLTCGHTLCIICIKRLGQNSPHFHCPLCKELVPLKSVKRNYTLLQLLTQLKKTSTGDLLNSALTTSFDSIKLDTLLDRGASGEVHRGTWQSNDVAIKIFASGQLTPEIQDSFRREVCVMSALRHPNVVLLLAACPTPPRLAIVMEFVRGGSLYSHLYINKTPFEFMDTVKLLIDVSRGLQYLHSINILHRDLKSKNVLLTAAPPNCQAKLCDFGLARMRLESVTMTGNIGTVHWTAPEVLNCARYHFPADVYGLGMVIYEVIARSIPFNGLPPATVIVAVLLRRETPKIPTDCNPDLSALCKRCLSWEPNDRPSIAAVLANLSSLMPELPSSDDNDVSQSVFDHVDSLGHVVMEVEFDETDLDSDLMDFLMASQNENAGEDSSSVAEPEDDDSKDFDSPLFVPVTSGGNGSGDTGDDGGVLSKQELDDIREESFAASYNDDDDTPYLRIRQPSYGYIERGGPTLTQQFMPPAVQSNQKSKIQPEPQPPKRFPFKIPFRKTLPHQKYSTKSKYPDEPTYHPLSMTEEDGGNGPSPNDEYSLLRLESGGIMNWNDEDSSINRTEAVQDINRSKLVQSKSTSSATTEEEDYEIARALMMTEKEQQLKNDYKIASILQKQYEESNAPNIKPPSIPKRPPPPPQLPLMQLPFMPTTKQLVSTTGRLKKLKSVTTKEKRGFRLGKVVDGVSNDQYNYTVQNEINHFSRKLLFPVKLKEPLPPYPVGRVVELNPYPYVKGIVQKINKSIESYDKSSMKNVMCLEKNPLPTAEDIKLEKSQGFESDPESYMKSKGRASDDQLTKGITRERGSESSPETGSVMLNDEPSGLQLTIDESLPSKSKTISKIFSKGGKKKKIAVSKSTTIDDSLGKSKDRGIGVVYRKKSLSPEEEDVPPLTTRSPVKKASSKSQPLFSSLSSHKRGIKSPDSREQQMSAVKKVTKQQQDIFGTTERDPLKKAAKMKKK